MKYIFLSIMLLTTITISAQKTVRNANKTSMLSFRVGGGLHGLTCPLEKGKYNNYFNYNIGIDYTYFFTPNWGISLGVGYTEYSGKGKIRSYTYQYDAIDTDNESYTMNVDANNLREKHTLAFIEIPVMVKYSYPITKNISLLSGIGFKTGFSTDAKYKLESGYITTTGHYSDNWVAKDKPEHGFYTDKDISGKKDDIKLKTAFSLVAETGIYYKLNDCWSLSGSLYGGYTLNNINDSKAATGLLSTSGDYNTYEGIMASELAKSIHPFSVGLKFGISYSF